ncbi:sulfatase-like hydrolase/transferase [Maioricimonas sp. JC845]|uniref:sulfatase-like hydrolase/transferase n=1 Tax=Maioricimonas sp. JC845 TaxID=3232138 RepID=UPI003458C1F8
MNRRQFCRSASGWLFGLLVIVAALVNRGQAADRPNILIAISDDQSWPHASAYGCGAVSTPAFDRVARNGVLFNNAFAASPGCSPCRAALLTGRQTWQIENAGTHASSFPLKYRTFPERLAEAGYFVGHTGKGWGPGNYKVDGRKQNPAGPAFSSIRTKPPCSGIRNTDYAANFDAFLEQREEGQPFCFWYGASEPHRSFEEGSGLKAGKSLDDVEVPPFLPDTPEIRSDILDYLVEIEWFDQHLARMLDRLEEAGELDNTIVIVTSDNGMAFPRAKANCYEYGIHMPLAICWGAKVPGGRTVDDLVQFVDLSATILDAAGLDVDSLDLTGHSLMNVLESDASGQVDPERTVAFSARERHSSSRYQNLAYPIRALRTPQYLYIRNFRHQRWPAGTPQKYEADGELGPPHGGYHDIDACPSLTYLVENRRKDAVKPYFHLAIVPRPEVELFDITSDPGCLVNLAGSPELAEVESQLREQFEEYLTRTGDPRMVNPDGGDVFETYRRYSRLRRFPVPAHVQEERERLQAEGWTFLFDGETLDGWRVSGPEDSFEVVNGMIRARAMSDQAHLYYVGPDGDADFTDFELVFESLATPGSNGGVYFHTSWQESGFPNDGHEVQVNNSHKNWTRTGSLFSVVDLSESPVADNVFFTQRVTVRGRHVTIDVNSERVVDYTEPEDYSHPRYTGRDIDHGTFALQAHDPESEVFYRNIRVRRLESSEDGGE